ncbi:MAG: MBL fold metallo-hydrolase [Candidatus Lokiarchaeota archaeon]|jgi:L-ascorbate metabolism protein UlaG (beta-lactamase superfamily)
MVTIIPEKIHSSEDFIHIENIQEEEVDLIWLGQAGFALKFKHFLILIDPYLSDFLSKKYKGAIFPHTRLMEIPLNPYVLHNVDFYFSTHAHSDHMDPETLSVIADNNPNLKVIVPAAEIKEAISRGAKKFQITSVNDGDNISLASGLNITAIAASHEAIKVNGKGKHHFLGYILDLGGIKLYHSGDCIPYNELSKRLMEYEIDLALLPINGRDKFRLTHGIAGNFTISEVLALCHDAGIKNLIVHHFGMFAYNTVRDDELEQLKSKTSPSLHIIVPEIKVNYKIIKSKHKKMKNDF